MIVYLELVCLVGFEPINTTPSKDDWHYHVDLVIL